MNEEIIVKCCGNIEARIKSCRSRAVAEHLKNHLCRELRFNCKSEVINAVLQRHVDELIQEYFDKEGHNIFINKKDQG